MGQVWRHPQVLRRIIIPRAEEQLRLPSRRRPGLFILSRLYVFQRTWFGFGNSLNRSQRPDFLWCILRGALLAIQSQVNNVVARIAGGIELGGGTPSVLGSLGASTPGALERLLYPRSRTRSHRTESAYIVSLDEDEVGTAILGLQADE